MYFKAYELLSQSIRISKTSLCWIKSQFKWFFFINERKTSNPLRNRNRHCERLQTKPKIQAKITALIRSIDSILTFSAYHRLTQIRKRLFLGVGCRKSKSKYIDIHSNLKYTIRTKIKFHYHNHKSTDRIITGFYAMESKVLI